MGMVLLPVARNVSYLSEAISSCWARVAIIVARATIPGGCFWLQNNANNRYRPERFILIL